MPVPLDEPALAARRQELLGQIAQLGDLRPGSLVERYRACGRASCWCAQPGVRGHGPQWILTTKVEGKTRTRAIPPQALAATRAQLAACQRLRALVAELITVSERICDGRVQAQRRAGRGSRKLGARPSSPRPRSNSTGA